LISKMTYTDAFTAVSQQINVMVGAGLSADLLLFIVSCFILIVSAELLVKALTKMAFYFRLSDFVVGFMIVALATSVPELFVGITSAMSPGRPPAVADRAVGRARPIMAATMTRLLPRTSANRPTSGAASATAMTGSLTVRLTSSSDAWNKWRKRGRRGWGA
jgi:hypothetical protein